MQDRYPSRVIFVCHEASRTGVPLLLLKMVKWLHQNHSTRALIITVKGGVLESEFKKIADLFVWGPPSSNGKSQRVGGMTRVRRRIARMTRPGRLRRALSEFKGEFVYINTVAAMRFMYENQRLFSGLNQVLHCHEMPSSIDRYVPGEMRQQFSKLHSVIVVNHSIKGYFERLGISPAKLLQVTEYFPSELERQPPSSNSGQVFTVLSAGLGSWRKGIDLFLLAAFYFSKKYDRPFVFKWIGYVPDANLRQYKHDVVTMGLSGRVEFVGEITNLSGELSAGDVFLLTSREDSYPVVMLEAASFKIPIVYFDQTGGASDFVNDADLAILPFDVAQMASKVNNLAVDSALRTAKGEQLYTRALMHTVENVGRRIFDFILTRMN